MLYKIHYRIQYKYYIYFVTNKLVNYVKFNHDFLLFFIYTRFILHSLDELFLIFIFIFVMNFLIIIYP